MSIPEELSRIIRSSLDHVREDPSHDLDLAHRDAILKTMGSREPNASLESHEGKRRRTVLAMLTARHVLPIWERVWPSNHSPHRALAAAEAMLQRPDHVADPYATIDDCQVEIEQVMRDDHLSACSGRSAVHALAVAVEDEFFDPVAVAGGAAATEGEYDDDTAASLAVMAYAGGSASNQDSDPALRQEFWEWWLTEAVPTAYVTGTLAPGSDPRTSP